MSKEYFGTFPGVVNEDLEAAGDGIPKFLNNINVASDATVTRGMLMAATSPGGTFSLASASDTNKYFAIARDDFEADSAHTVCQAWTMGRFHAPSVITTGGSDTTVLRTLEPELRKQNIHLVGLQEIYGKCDPWQD